MTQFEILMKKLNGEKCMMGTNSDGETVIVEHFAATEEVDEHVKVSTAQNNDWLRINCYYPDGSSDETYER